MTCEQVVGYLLEGEGLDQLEQPAGEDINERHDQREPPKEGMPTLSLPSPIMPSGMEASPTEFVHPTGTESEREGFQNPDSSPGMTCFPGGTFGTGRRPPIHPRLRNVALCWKGDKGATGPGPR